MASKINAHPIMNNMFERLQINPNQSFVYDELLSAFESGYFNREKKETAEGELKRWLE